MSQPSYIVLAFSVLNLLLAACGLLLVYFDWSAARRREFLYLSFSEDKPGVNYFAAARRRRAQYTRLLASFGVLAVRDFLSVLLFAQIAKPNDFAVWVSWCYGQPLAPELASTITPALQSLITRPTTELFSWMYCLDILALILLGFGLLYDPQAKKNTAANVPVAVFTIFWIGFTLLAVCGVFGPRQRAVVMNVTLLLHFILISVIMYKLWWRSEPDDEQGLLTYDADVLLIAFAAWLGGFWLSTLAFNPAPAVLGQTVAYVLLVGVIARSVLVEYETVESSRHRLGRERQVIFSFLQRIGAAFTKELQFEQVLRIVLDTALETTEASAGAIYLYYNETGRLEPRVVRGFFPPLHVNTPAALSPHRTEELQAEMERQSFQLGQGVIGEVAESGRARIIDDVKVYDVMLGTTTDFMRNKSMLIVPLSIRDEPLGVMAVLNKQRGSFGDDDQSLLQGLGDQAALSINHALLTLEIGRQERLRRDLQIAHDIQQRMLPKECPVVPGFKIGARGTPAMEVGGDYYDFFWVDKDHLGIVVADVSGKGVPAAITVATIRSAFRTLTMGNADVREVLSKVNDFMSQDLRRDMFITCVYGILEVSTRTFSWARAGHEPLIVAHSHAPIDVLTPGGFALGVVPSPEFGDFLEVNTMELHSGDRVLMFTDGLTEAMNSSGEEFGMQRILNVMEHLEGADGAGTANGYVAGAAAKNGSANGTVVGTRPATQGAKNGESCASNYAEDEPEDLKTIERAVQNHVAGAPPSDDLTIVYLSAN